jgi:UDP:flavonoid glycosyltransferase YjiC (YdhE family)
MGPSAMKVLFTCVVGPGHFNPLAPLALAFRAAGHPVAFATDPGFAPHIRSVGFEVFGAGLDMPEARRRFQAVTPEFERLPPWARGPLLHAGLFGGVRIEPMLDDLGPILADWRPDLLIHDSVEMAGAIAAELAGIPHVEHSFGLLRPVEARSRATVALEPVAARLGIANPGVGGLNGELYLDICPPTLQVPEIADLRRVQPLRPATFDDPPDSILPSWLASRPSRPLVYVTMGTEFNQRPEIFRAILDGLAAEPIEVVVTVGSNGDPDALGPVRPNVRIERFVQQSRLLALASVFVSHGGSGALFGALRAGVPMLAIPQGADQFLNAEAIVEHGIGLRLMPDDLSPAAVRDAVRALNEEPSYREAFRSHVAAIESMPAPEKVVGLLEAMVAERREG